VLNDDLVGPGDFHACNFMEEYRPHDLSSTFINAIEAAPIDPARPTGLHQAGAKAARTNCQALLASIMADDEINDVNRIKPGVAEATRAILRRVPDKLYLADIDDPEVQHMILLARTAGVPIIERDLSTYRAVAIIKKLEALKNERDCPWRNPLHPGAAPQPHRHLPGEQSRSAFDRGMP
jgi:hypothetical protein